MPETHRAQVEVRAWTPAAIPDQLPKSQNRETANSSPFGDMSLPPIISYESKAEVLTREKSVKFEPSSDDRSAFSKIADWIFKPKAIEADGTIYKFLGVHLFKAALMGTLGKLSTPRSGAHAGNNYHIGGHSISDLKKMESWTRFNEAWHMGAILVTNLPTIANAFMHRHPQSPIILGCLVLNLYCVMLQRYNRERLCKTIERAESRPSQRIPRFTAPSSR